MKKQIVIAPETLALEPSYLAHTNYQDYPGGRKKLRVIVQACRDLEALLQKRLSVLDVGCGNGSVSLPLASLEYDVTGIDVSAGSIEQVKKNSRFANARFLVHDLATAPLAEKYDFIVCSEVLEHLEHPEPLVKAMAATLVPGGMIVITVPNGYGFREVMGRMEHRLEKSASIRPALNAVRKALGMKSAKTKCLMHTSNPDQDHVQKFTVRQLSRLLGRSGLHAEIWVNSFWMLSLFGKANQGVGRLARFDSWMADHLPRGFASGWFLFCRQEHGAGTRSN